jgi:uncharacterized protein YbjT (DUF2867 family)
VTPHILLAGASGLIGSKLVQLLSGMDVHLHILTRRIVEKAGAAMVQIVSDPTDWPKRIAELNPDVAISCLGTTWNKSGKNEAAFRAVDLDLVLAFADTAKKAGARHMISVSSVGASAKSSGFYLRTKGQAEEGLADIGFERLDIMRPGLLTGERGRDRRLGEHVGIILSPFTDALIHGSFRRYRSINSAIVATAIGNLAIAGGQGQFIHENDAITALAR